jgi:hypothetical protein
VRAEIVEREINGSLGSGLWIRIATQVSGFDPIAEVRVDCMLLWQRKGRGLILEGVGRIFRPSWSRFVLIVYPFSSRFARSEEAC